MIRHALSILFKKTEKKKKQNTDTFLCMLKLSRPCGAEVLRVIDIFVTSGDEEGHSEYTFLLQLF